VQNVYLVERLADQRRAERLADAAQQRLVACARAVRRSEPLHRVWAGLPTALVGWLGGPIGAFQLWRIQKGMQPCPDCQ
jgi:hypothetical protein